MSQVFEEVETVNKIKLDYVKKGDLLVGSGTTSNSTTSDLNVFSVGASGYVLTANTQATFGVEWQSIQQVIQNAQSFGASHSYFESEASVETDVNLPSFKTASTFQFSISSSGTYRLGWGFIYFAQNSGNNYLTVRSILDSDSSNVLLAQTSHASNGSALVLPSSYFIKDYFLTSGIHQMDITMAASSNNKRVNLRSMRYEVWRV